MGQGTGPVPHRVEDRGGKSRLPQGFGSIGFFDLRRNSDGRGVGDFTQTSGPRGSERRCRGPSHSRWSLGQGCVTDVVTGT